MRRMVVLRGRRFHKLRMAAVSGAIPIWSIIMGPDQGMRRRPGTAERKTKARHSARIQVAFEGRPVRDRQVPEGYTPN